MATTLSPQAVKLNETIRKENPVVYSFLSQKGRAVYYPKDGILAQTAQAKNTKINATIGMALEDDGSPIRLSSIADTINLKPKEIFPYAPSAGDQKLREIWLSDLKKKNPSLKGKTSLPVVTSALTHALAVIGYLFLDEGDKIIIPDKIWGNYKLIFELAYGGKLDYYNTFSENGFDLYGFRKKIAGASKEKTIIFFNFPNNPTGYTITEKEAKEIIRIIEKEAKKGRKMLVICDDAYFGLIFKQGIYRESLFSPLSNLHENVLAVKADGATKEQYVWGLRVGFITYGGKAIREGSYLALEDKTQGAIRASTSSSPRLSQSLILHAFSSQNYQKEKLAKFKLLKARFDKVCEVLQNPKYQKYFSPLPFNSGYFMCIKLKEGLDAEKIRKLLISKYSTGVISIKNLLRIAFSSVAEKNIPTLFENIYKACDGKRIP